MVDEGDLLNFLGFRLYIYNIHNRVGLSQLDPATMLNFLTQHNISPNPTLYDLGWIIRVGWVTIFL